MRPRYVTNRSGRGRSSPISFEMRAMSSSRPGPRGGGRSPGTRYSTTNAISGIPKMTGAVPTSRLRVFEHAWGDYLEFHGQALVDREQRRKNSSSRPAARNVAFVRIQSKRGLRPTIGSLPRGAGALSVSGCASRRSASSRRSRFYSELYFHRNPSSSNGTAGSEILAVG